MPCSVLETNSVSMLGACMRVSGGASFPLLPPWAESALKEGTGSHASSYLLWAQ